MVAGVFGLKKVYKKQKSNEWPEDPNFGYFGGGSAPPTVNTIDRIDFSNETTSAPGNNLTDERMELSSASNSNYGYFVGGSFSNTIRLDFSNETVINTEKNISPIRRRAATVSNSNYSYFGGGYGSSPTPKLCIIDRLDYSTEVITTSPANLTQARDVAAAVSSSNYGYFGGGYFVPPTTYYCTFDRLDFSTETVTGPPIHGINLTQGRSSAAAVSNSNYGYFAGGVFTPPTTRVCTIDRLDFSNETVTAPGSYQLSQAKSALAAVSNFNYGYFGGAYSPVRICTIDRLDFTTETVTTPAPTLTQARGRFAAVPSGASGATIRHLPKTTSTDIDGKPISSNSNYGYFVGGAKYPTRHCIIDRLDFSTETVTGPSVHGINLTEARVFPTGISNSNYGYIAGDQTAVCTIDRLDFSNETTSESGANLTEGRFAFGGVSNSNYGYFGGGGPSPDKCTIDRLDFSNETVAAPGSYQLTSARAQLTGVHSSNYGYFAGGSTSGPPIIVYNTIDRLDFSNETIQFPIAIQLTEGKIGFGGVSNSNYGYFGGGTTPPRVCTIERLDFSNETVAAPGSYQLTEARSSLAAVSNSQYGYFAGGYGPTTYTCTIDRLDFSNETTSAPGNDLTAARYRLGAVSN